MNGINEALFTLVAPLLLTSAITACRVPSTQLDSTVASESANADPAAFCHGKTVLVVTSASGYITLKGGEQYPTGYFLRELTDPLIPLINAGCRFEFATPGGLSPVIDSNSLELLWAYYPYPELKAAAAAHRLAGIQVAESIYGKLRFSEEKPQWKRISTEVQAFVQDVEQRQAAAGLVERPVTSLEAVAERLAASDQAGAASPYVALLVPGGHVPMEDLKVSPALGRVMNHFHSHMLPTSLVCHAPVALLSTATVGPMIYEGYTVSVADRVAEQLLEQMGPLQGYRVQSYVDDDLAAAGVKLDQNPWPGYPQVHADREVITAQNPASAPFLGLMLIESIKLYTAHAGTDAWWLGRDMFLSPSSIQAEQAEAMAKEKALADVAVKSNASVQWKVKALRHLLGLSAPTPTNIFLSSSYLSLFDDAMRVSSDLSTTALYPATGSPQLMLNRFPIPLVDFAPGLDVFHVLKTLHNYYLPFPNGFYAN